jgi:hypothetical protein
MCTISVSSLEKNKDINMCHGFTKFTANVHVCISDDYTVKVKVKDKGTGKVIPVL